MKDMNDDRHNPPCETVLLIVIGQFREFAAKIAEFNAYSEDCLFCAKTKWINDHDNDCVWIEAKRIIASIDKHNETT
jgi:hypothetical protein